MPSRYEVQDICNDIIEFAKKYKDTESPLYKDAFALMKNMIIMLYNDFAENVCDDENCIENEQYECCGCCYDHCKCDK